MMLCYCAVIGPVLAEQPAQEPPHWSIEVKGGKFEPDAENWETFYGKKDTDQYGVAWAYKPVRQMEVGLSIDFSKDRGKGLLADNSIGGRVEYEQFPVTAFVLLRGVFNENQWVVPYVGIGYTQLYYKVDIQNDDKREGDTGGIQTRAGLQFLLDPINKRGALGLQRDFGVENLYLVLEVQELDADKETVSNGGADIELGGTSYLIGLLFEY